MSRPSDPGRQDVVLDQVIGYVAEHGLTGLSLRRLSASLGFSTNVISYQFGSKQGLIEAALLRSRVEQQAVYERLIEREPTATTADAFLTMWDWWMEDPAHLAYSRLSIEAFLDSELPTPEFRETLLPYWVRYFREWLMRDGHGSSMAEDLSTLFLATQTGLITDVVSGGDRQRVRAAAERFAELLKPPLPDKNSP